MKKITASLLLLAVFNGSIWAQAASTQPDQPGAGGDLELVAQFDMVHGEGMVINRDIAFVGLQRNEAYEVVVLDLSNLVQPAVLAVIPFDNYYTHLLALVGDLLYVGVFGGEIIIFDVSDPSNPVQVGSFTPIYHDIPSQMVVSGNTAHLGYYTEGVVIMDISDPVHPTMIGSYSGSGFSRMAVQGHYAYTLRYNLLEIFDIANPALPKLVGSYDPGNNRGFPPGGVFSINGSYAYLAGVQALQNSSGPYAEVIDISDPYHPEKISDLPQLAIFLRYITISGSLLYAVGDPGLEIFNLSDPLDPQLLGTYLALSGLIVHPQGDRAAFLDQIAGFQTLDTSDPAHPKRLGLYGWPDIHSNHLTASGTNLYTHTTYGIGFPDIYPRELVQVIDISDPDAPAASGNLVLDAHVLGKAFVSERYIYLPCENGLTIVDATNPGNMKSASLDLNGATIDIQVQAANAYVLTRSVGGVPDQGSLSIFDVSQPFTPTLLGEYIVDGYVNDLSLAQQGEAMITYIATQAGWLAVDVSDPSAPVLVYQDTSSPHNPAGRDSISGCTNHRLSGNICVGPGYCSR